MRHSGAVEPSGESLPETQQETQPEPPHASRPESHLESRPKSHPESRPETYLESRPEGLAGSVAEHRPRPERVGLYEDGGIAWRRVSPRLATARSIAWTLALLLPVALFGSGLAVTGWLAIPTVVVVLAWLGGLWLIRRQVAAISYAELAEELVIRKGRLARSLVSVPYGRLQYIDVQSGPLARRLGMAEVELHTASPQTGGSIPGLPVEEAEALRQRLAARGESQRAGL
jgi:membrane protein YdbS with pleckstrin-like domain